MGVHCLGMWKKQQWGDWAYWLLGQPHFFRRRKNHCYIQHSSFGSESFPESHDGGEHYIRLQSYLYISTQCRRVLWRSISATSGHWQVTVNTTAATVDPPTAAASASVSAPDSCDVDKQPGQQAASSLESEQPQTVTSCDVPVSSPPTDAANPPTTADSVSAEPFAVTFWPRSFASSAPKLCNSLPLPLRDSTLTLRQFGSRLKTHLFSLAYGCASWLIAYKGCAI